MKTDNGNGRALAALKLAEQAAKGDAEANVKDTAAAEAKPADKSGAVKGELAKGDVSRVKVATPKMTDRFESRAKSAESFIDYASPMPATRAPTQATPQAQTAGGAPRRGIQNTDVATTQEIPNTTAGTTSNTDAPAATPNRATNPDLTATTRAIGEESGGRPEMSTRAIGEEGGGAPGTVAPPQTETPPTAVAPPAVDTPPGAVTTMAIGEEGGSTPPNGGVQTMAIPEEGGMPPGAVTTMAMGEEGGSIPPNGGVQTMAIPEEGGTRPGGDVLPSVPVKEPVQQACAQNPQMQAQAAQAFQQVININIVNIQINYNQPPAPACTPAPRMDLSCAPAGKGLSKDPAGWPQGSVKTAGGYVVVPEGKDSAWSIFAPGQKPGDKAHTRIWGDPHVSEKDGTRWDFTKSSDFVLPDGTRIHAQTTSETGKSVTKGLTLSNGHERIQIDGINTGKPKTGEMLSDGYAWRAQHAASQNRDSFHLGGSADDVRWFRERITDGKTELAEVTGAKFDAKQNRYEQTVDNGKKYWVDPQLRPQLGAPAFGPAFQNALAPQMGAFPGNLGNAQWNQGLFTGQSQFNQLNPAQYGGFDPFGGLGRSFPDFRAVFQAIMMLQQQLLMMQLMGGAHRF